MRITPDGESQLVCLDLTMRININIELTINIEQGQL